MKKGLRRLVPRLVGVSTLLLIILTFLIPILPAHAAPADAYWVGNGGNWTDAANHWSNVSGGAPGAGNMPDVTSAVHFDAQSFTLGGQNVTFDAASPTCLSMNWTGVTNNPTIDWNGQNLKPFTNVVFASPAEMTIAGTGQLRYFGTGAESLTTNGQTIGSNIINTDTGTLTFNDDVTMGANRIISIEKGGLDTNGKTVTVVRVAVSTNPVTISLGSSIINVVSASSAQGWELTPVVTLSPNTASIRLSGAGSAVFNGGNAVTYNEVQFLGVGHIISGNNTVASIVTPSGTTQTLSFTDGTTQTVTNATLSGSAGHVHTLQGTAAAGWGITKAGGGAVIANYIAANNSTALPAATWFYNTATSTVTNSSGWNALTVASSAPTNIGMTAGTHADLNGTATNLNGSGVLTYFQWGYTTSYGNNTANQAGHASSTYTATISGFDPNQVVHYRIAVTDGTTTVYGSDQSFSVAGSAPSAPSYTAFNFANSVIPVLFVAFVIFLVMMLILGEAVSPLLGIILGAVAILVGMAFLQGIQSLLNAMWGG
jgi:hypothetical protein